MSTIVVGDKNILQVLIENDPYSSRTSINILYQNLELLPRGEGGVFGNQKTLVFAGVAFKSITHPALRFKRSNISEPTTIFLRGNDSEKDSVVASCKYNFQDSKSVKILKDAIVALNMHFRSIPSSRCGWDQLFYVKDR